MKALYNKATSLSPRLERFRREIINVIPRFPNDYSSKKHMENMPLGEVLVNFVNWRARFIGIRPRKVLLMGDPTNDTRWLIFEKSIKALLDKAVSGADLSPYLSNKARNRGVRAVPREGAATAEEKWADKDFILTTKGLHHFHLTPQERSRRKDDRSNLMIFAQVSRDEFFVFGLFDHSVFTQQSLERKRLQGIHDSWRFRNIAPGAVYIDTMITTSAHSLDHVEYAKRCGRILREIDSQLEDAEFLQSIFAETGVPIPLHPEFEWRFHHLDLSVYEKSSDVNFNLSKGWN